MWYQEIIYFQKVALWNWSNHRLKWSHHMPLLFWALASPLPIQFPADTIRKAVDDIPSRLAPIIYAKHPEQTLTSMLQSGTVRSEIFGEWTSGWNQSTNQSISLSLQIFGYDHSYGSQWLWQLLPSFMPTYNSSQKKKILWKSYHNCQALWNMNGPF